VLNRFLSVKTISPEKHPHWIAYILILNNTLFGMAMDIHLPSMPIMVEDLKTTEFMVQLIVILFAFGAIFSRLLWGPVSDLYGRRKIMLITIGIQTFGQLGCTVSPNIEVLVFFRAVQSLGAGISSVLATAIIADLFAQRTERARILGLLEMSFPIAFIMAPIIGAFLVELTHGWRANFIVILLFCIVSWLLVYRYIPETHTPNGSTQRISMYFRTYRKLLGHVKFVSYSSMVGLIIAAYMMFVINAPFVYMSDFGLDVRTYAIYQFIPMLFNMFSVLIYRVVVKFLGVSKCARYGVYALVCLVPLYFTIGIVNTRWSADTILAVICMQSLIVPFIIPGFTAKALDKFPDIRGMSSSAIGSIRTLFMSLGMFIGSYVIGSKYDKLFVAMGIIIGIVFMMYYVFHIKELQYSKKKLDEPEKLKEDIPTNPTQVS
jgi:DHA1 family bicyclomycin/chloramphenicol resistance-like MFS transporter